MKWFRLLSVLLIANAVVVTDTSADDQTPLKLRASTVGIRVLAFAGDMYITGAVQGQTPFWTNIAFGGHTISTPSTTQCSAHTLAVYNNPSLGNHNSNTTCSILLGPSGVAQADQWVNNDIKSQFDNMKQTMAQFTGVTYDPLALQGTLAVGDNNVTFTVTPRSSLWSIDVEAYTLDNPSRSIRQGHMDNTLGQTTLTFAMHIDAP